MAFTVPPPRSSPEARAHTGDAGGGAVASGAVGAAEATVAAGATGTAGVSDATGIADGAADALARWYERELGWVTAGRAPVRLLTGLRFDVLELPADAGLAVLRRAVRTGPVALAGARMRLLVAAGSADELPGLLDWLEWGGVALDLTVLGTGGRITAPAPAGAPESSPGAAFWLRPPHRGTRWSRHFRLSRASGAAVGVPPISYGWWTRWRRNATGSGCRAPGWGC